MSNRDPKPATRTQLVPLRDYQQFPSPALPYSAGSDWGSRLGILRKDTAYVRQHADFLNGRAAQADAMGSLVDARINLAVKLSQLSSIAERCATEYLKGRRQRAHDLRLLHLKCETEEVTQQIILANERKQLATITPAPTSPPTAPAHRGLTPAEVDEILANFPEIASESRETIHQVLKARVEESDR